MVRLWGVIVIVFFRSVQVCIPCDSPSRILTEQLTDPIAVKKSQFPFAVALVDPQKPEQILCSGSIITSTMVLTSRLCIPENLEIEAYFGVVRFPLNASSAIEKRYFTKEDILVSDDDVLAVLTLQKPLQFNGDVRLINLAYSGHIGADAITLFWTPDMSSNLKHAYVKVDSVFQELLPIVAYSSINGKTQCLLEICDPGAPLIQIQNGVERLIGIYSQRSNGLPSSLTQFNISIADYLDWLLVTIEL